MKRAYSFIVLFLATTCTLFFLYQLAYVQELWAWVFFAVVSLLELFLYDYFKPSSIRFRKAISASNTFRNICDNIVNYQYYPENNFDKKDLKKALGFKLPKPTYNDKSDEIYTLQLFDNFKIVIRICCNWMNTGGGATYSTYESTGYSFGTCELFENELLCGDFSYHSRYIAWKTEEFEDINGEDGSFEHLYNRKKLADEIEEAKIARMFKEIEAENEEYARQMKYR